MDFVTILGLLNGFASLAEMIRTGNGISDGITPEEMAQLKQRSVQIQASLILAYDEAEAQSDNES